MCDPLTIAGAALTIGSTVANYAAAQRVDKARADAMAAERIRQGTLDREAEALNLTSRDRYQGFEEQQEAKATTLGDYFAGQRTTEPPPMDAMPTSSSGIVVRNENEQRNKARQLTDKTGDALGNLRAFGDLLGGIGREQAQDASLIGQIGGFKQGAAGVLPLELDAANEKGAGLRMLGDILGGVGSVAVSSGLGGGGIKLGSPQVSTPSVQGFHSPALYPATSSGLKLGNIYGGR